MSQTFSFALSDPDGAADIATVYVIVNSQLSGVNGCQIAFDRPSRLLWLIADNGTTWLTAGTVGSGSITSNTQCSLDPTGSSLSLVGNVLTLNLSLAFKPAFSGTKQIYLLAVDRTGLNTGWQQIGSWTNASARPSVVSLTPASGSGSSQTFSFAVSDPEGAGDIATVYVIVNSGLSGVNGCYIAFDRASSLLWLIADNGTTWLTAGAVGSGSITSNTQCSLDPTGSSLSLVGNVLTLSLRLVFKPAFAGTKQIFLLAVDRAGLNTGWQQIGSWTNASARPSVVSLTPASGSGGSQTFSFAVSDPEGASDIATIYVIVNSGLSGVNGCYVAFDRASSLLWLIADNGTTWLTAGTVGSGSITSNTQCSLDPASSSLSVAGNVLTLSLRLVFKPAFSGAKKIFLFAGDRTGLNTGWQQIGSWTN